MARVTINDAGNQQNQPADQNDGQNNAQAWIFKSEKNSQIFPVLFLSPFL